MTAFILRLFCLTAALSFSSVAFGQEPDKDELDQIETEIRKMIEEPSASEGELHSGEAIFHGFVFLRGRYLPPPYLLRWDGAEMTLNGMTVPIHGLDSEGGQKRSGTRLMAQFEQHLRANGMMISVDGEPVRFLDAQWALKILETLLRNVSWPVKCDALVRLGCEELHSGQWSALVQRFRANVQISERVEALREALATRQGSKRSAQITSSAHLAVALGLALLGFATVVNFRPVTGQWWEVRASRRRSRMVTCCVAVFAGLGLYDVACNSWAARTATLLDWGVLEESLLIDGRLLSALQAVLIVAIAAVLFKWRHYQIAQAASWWICLLCTIFIVCWCASFMTLPS